MSQEEIVRARAEQGLPWIILRPLLPLWYAGVGWSWWRVYQAELASSAPPPGVLLPPGWVVIGVALAGKLCGWLGETGTYALLWKAWGRRLPFWRLFAVVVSASMADLFAHSLAAHAPGRAAPWWLPVLAGPHLAQGSVFAEAPAARAAFGSLGLLTLTRIGMTAAAQARGLGSGLAAPLAVTTATWLLSRGIVFFTVDLIRGMSPLGGD